MKAGKYRAQIEEVRLLSPDTGELTVYIPDAPKAVPGQYAMFDAGPEFTLKRAFSIADSLGNNRYSFMIKIRGEASEKFVKSPPSEFEIIFPLGNGFPVCTKQRVLLIGGGCGVFPLLWLSKVLKSENEVALLHGVEKEEDLFLKDRFRGIEQIFYTVKPSDYNRGMVTDYFKGWARHDVYYICGPSKMAKALHEILPQKSSFYSLEEKFACGYGVCLGCSIKTSEGMKRVCKEGPVFCGEILTDESF